MIAWVEVVAIPHESTSRAPTLRSNPWYHPGFSFKMIQARVGSGSEVSDSLKKHRGVGEEFGDFEDGVFESVFENKVDEI